MEESAKTFIINYLCTPPGIDAPAGIPPGSGNRQRWHPLTKTATALTLEVDPASLEFLAEKSLADHQIYILSFSDKAKRKFDLICVLALNQNNKWTLERGLIGRTGLRLRTFASRQAELVGFGRLGQGRIIAGFVPGLKPDVVKARLFSADGTLLEETAVSRNTMLFVLTSPVSQPTRLELYDSAGKQISVQNGL